MLRKSTVLLVAVAVLGSLPAFGDSEDPPPQFVPQQKACVGNPPRQTDDPLSPPCVPFFDGSNGGSTWRGVTGDEIKVVLYNDLGIRGDMRVPWSPEDGDTFPTVAYEDVHVVRTVKAQLRYFQHRYQTYGRVVRLIAHPSSEGVGSSCSERQADAAITDSTFAPFAVAILGSETQCYQKALAGRGVPSFSVWNDAERGDFTDAAGLMWSFDADQNTLAGLRAGFICRSLAGRDARFSPDPDLRERTRRFGLIAPVSSLRPQLSAAADKLSAALSKQCGVKVVTAPYLAESTLAPSGAQEAALIMAKFKLENVTTVMCYCIPVSPRLTVTVMQNAATSLAYRPEWYWDSATAMDRVQWQRQYGDPKHVSIGISSLWRQPAFEQSSAYLAYQSVEPGTSPNTRFNFEIYHVMLNLFTAVQSAGPTVTPTSVEQGMFTFRQTSTANPFLPTGGYGNYSSLAVSRYTFLDTGMAWWYDPAGTEPGGAPGTGCLRLMRDGRRFWATTWPTDDGSMLVGSAPCSGPIWKLYDV